MLKKIGFSTLQDANDGGGGTIMPDGPIKSGEGENLLDNDELSADNLQ